MKISILLTLFVFLISPVNAETKDDHSPRFLVHLLDYLAKDYGGAVANGKIINPSEYQEQIEFINFALVTNKELKETRSNPEIGNSLKSLHELITSKASAALVSKLAREIQTQVIQVTGIEVAPIRWPSLKKGKQLFAKNCTACHGTTGAGDGPAAGELDPRPTNFLDNHMMDVSPFQAFNTIRLGVPGTGMLPFHQLSDKEAWDLAFYVVSLRYSRDSALNIQELKHDENDLKIAATTSDHKLSVFFQTQNNEEKLKLITALRTHSDDDDSGNINLQIARTYLDEAVKDYELNQRPSAKKLSLAAYLEGIEPIEPRLRASDPETLSRLEAKMFAVRSTIEQGASLSEVKSKVNLAKAEIDNVEQILSAKKMSPWLAFMAAAAILFREGFEAVLVVITLLGVIRATGAQRAAIWVHVGWISALGLGILAWFFSGWLMNISGAQRETLEGGTSLFAVIVLLVIGFWFHSQTEIGRWHSFLHGKVKKALESKRLWGLASISFIAVFREAFETVLFLRAIWLEGGEESKLALMAGVVTSLSLVIAISWAILKYSAKLPIRRLFEASAIIMATLALVLTGKGLHSFQETGILSVTSSPSLFHFEFLGIYPTVETLVAQVMVFVLIIILWKYGKKSSITQPG